MAYMQKLEGAKARGDDIGISSKTAIEICSFLRGMELEKALATLARVQKKNQAVPFKRFTDGVGHRPGKMGAGRYPVKAAGEFIKLFNNAKANASDKGMTGTLIIAHLSANRASRPFRNRSKYRGEFKRTHVEVILTERKSDKKPVAKVKPVQEKPKTDVKPKAAPVPKVEKKIDTKPVETAPKPAPKVEEKKEAPKAVEKKVEEKPVPKVEQKSESQEAKE
ncbi:50S ribosomal protein L22 [Candidatus Woesearchaeota archaeon]|nr:50S ribosomal protein L22 [Candidatus Woesearchaeota archaeon]